MSDITLALAGIFQAAYLVKRVACEGQADEHDTAVCIKSILEVDPPNAEAVYGGRSDLATGLRLVGDQLGDDGRRRDLDIAGYVIAAMHLERKLMRRPAMVSTLRTGIGKVRAQVEHFSVLHENVIAALADLYVNTISTLTPRIIVHGEEGHLRRPANASKVRALLLAAVRAAVLWRQCGGTRWQLAFHRNKFAQEANRLRYNPA